MVPSPSVKSIINRRDTLLVFLSIATFFCIALGTRPYLTPSEARYIEIPRQMLATGDWLTPRINGVPYFEKPPLFYWMQAAFMQFFGTGEFAGRFITAMLSAGICAITFALARRLHGLMSGLFSALVLATCLLGYGLSRVATLDIPVSFFVTGTIAAFLAAQLQTDQKQKNCLYTMMYIAAALAVMTKGLLGVAVPGMVIGAWVLIGRRWYIFREARIIVGCAVFLIIAAPWHFMMAKLHPDFLNFYFIHEHFTRYLTTEHRRTAPWWFFIAVTLVGLLPWLGLLPDALRRLTRTDTLKKADKDLFLLLWIFLPLLFFSLSSSKLLPYIFPVFPPLAIIMGKQLAGMWEGNLPDRALRINSWLNVILFSVALAACALLPALTLPGKPGAMLATMPSLPPLFLIPSALSLAAILAILLQKKDARHLIGSLALFGAVFGISANYIIASLDNTSIKPLAAKLRETLKPDDLVIAYNSYWQDLPVYLNSNIVVAGWTGELDFGVSRYPETRQWMISLDALAERCAQAPHGVYVIARKNDVHNLPESCTLREVESYGKTILLEKENP